MSCACESFRAAMRQAGLDYAGPIVADGRRHRFRAEGDKSRNSWYVIYPGEPAAGVFGCWKRCFKEIWHDQSHDLSQAQWDSTRHRWREAEAACEQEEALRRAKARKVAAWIVARSKPADTTHPYLVGKGVATHGLLQYRAGLVVPLCDVKGELHSMQFINQDGTKYFLRDGGVSGCYFIVDDKPDGPLLIAEGYATAASIAEATRFATVAAMNCGNLLPVAKALRSKWPSREIIVCGDDDGRVPGNPGVTKATEAAKSIGARLVIAQFTDASGTDFNDLARVKGRDEVRRQIEAAAQPSETDEELLERLARMTPLEYERSRKVAASKLGIKRLSALDAEVALRRPESHNGVQGSAVSLPDPEPWPEPVDGAELLTAVASVFLGYAALPIGAADAMALWVAHTHCHTAFLHSPRLNPCSPVKGCGKSLLLDLLATLTPRALLTESITPAVLFRLVESCSPTLLLDEVDTYLGEAEELRGLLNAGHKRGARAYRCEGEGNVVRGFNAFAPAALAGIGYLPGTLHDRAIVIRLLRAKPGEVASRFDCRHVETETELCRKLARWTKDHFAELEAADPVLPESAYNRVADNWRALFAIAQVAGGDWSKRAAAAFAALSSEDCDEAIGTTLLADIEAIFGAAGTDRLPSARLAELLAGIEGRPWAEFGKNGKPISPNQLARQLKRFTITPDSIRLSDGTTPKGYYLDQFTEAFSRFLRRTPPIKPQHATNPVTATENGDFKTQQEETCCGSENASPANNDRACCASEVQNPPPAQNEENDDLL